MSHSSVRRAALVLYSTLAVTLATGCRQEPTRPLPPSKTHPAGEIFATTFVGSRPYGVAISSRGAVYVARLDTQALSRGQLPTPALTTGPSVGFIPSHVAFNPAGTRAYVANQGSANVSVIDVSANAAIAAIQLPSDAWNVLVSADGSRLYATTNQGYLAVVNTATNAIVGALTLGFGDALRGIVQDAPRNMLYVAGRNSGKIYVVDTRTNALVRTLMLGGTPQRIAVSADGAELYVANEARGLDIVTLASGAFRTVALGGGGGYGLALSPDGEQLYVTVPDAGVTRVLHRATGVVVNTFAMGGRPRNVAFSATGEYAVISNETSGSVAFVR